jgi:hypothetical protein
LPLDVAGDAAVLVHPNSSGRDRAGAIANIILKTVAPEELLAKGAGLAKALNILKNSKATAGVARDIEAAAKGLDTAEIEQALAERMPKGARKFADKEPKTTFRPVAEPKAEPVKAQGRTTGVSMAAREVDAAAGKRPMPESLKGLSNEEAYNKALKSEVDHTATLKSLADAKRPATQEEVAGFAVDSAKLQRQLDELGAKLDANPTDAATRQQYNEHWAKVEEFDKNLDIVKAESGRSLNAFKIGTNLEDMSFQEIKREAKRRYGVDLKPKQEAAFKKLQGELDSTKTTLAERDALISKLQAEGAVNMGVRSSRRGMTKADLKVERDQILASLGKLGGGQASLNWFPAKQTYTLVKKLANNLIEDGFVTLAEITDHIKGLIPGISDKDVHDAISGNFEKTKRAKGEFEDIKADIRSEAGARSKVATLEEELASGNLKSPEAKKVRFLEGERQALQDKLDSLRRQKAARLKALEPKSIVSKANSVARDIQLANPTARAMDVLQNTTKMTSYMAQNPGRSLMGQIAFGKTVGRETLITPGKLLRVFKGAPARWRTELADVLKGADLDTLEKYGKAPGVVTRLTGTTDIPFKDIYNRLALDDYAVTAAGKNKPMRAQIWRQLTEGAKGPLTDAQVAEAKAIAHDWSLRQTLNNDNVVSDLVNAGKEAPARAIEKRVGGKAGKEMADGWRFLVDSFGRFSKVITNATLDKVNYVHGLEEAGGRLALGKREGLLAKIPAKDARLISDLAAKGLTGIGMYKLGQAGYEYLKSQDWIKGEVVTTKGGTKFVKWTLFPEYLGGIDADQLGGVLSPFLRGATRAMIDQSNLTEKQKEEVYARYEQDQLASSPLASNLDDALAVKRGEKTLGQLAGSITARQIIPGGVADLARRMDNDTVRKSSGFWDEWIKRIPGYRETLPSNEKRRR